MAVRFGSVRFGLVPVGNATTRSQRETHCVRNVLNPNCKICCRYHFVLNKHIQSLLLAATTFNSSWFRFLCEKENAFARQSNTQSAVYVRPRVAASGKFWRRRNDEPHARLPRVQLAGAYFIKHLQIAVSISLVVSMETRAKSLAAANPLARFHGNDQ